MVKLKRKKATTENRQPTEEVTKPMYNSLSEVMDKKRDIAFFYSGVEYDLYLNGCYEMGIRDFLMSYHYIRGKEISGIFDKYPDIHLFVDSGGYTFLTDSKYWDYTEEQWEKHIKSYLRWAEKHKNFIFAIANLDIEGLVGPEKVMEWNKKYFEPFMLRTGIPVCFVYHSDATCVDWEYYCKRYPYVGFSSVADGKDLEIDEIKRRLKIAEKYDSLVHGFGMTRVKMLSELPYYTVDSTTWKVGMRYGKLIIFDGKAVKQIDKDDWETKALPLIRNYPININIDLLWEYDEPEVIRANVYAFMQAENYVKDRIKHLQYWKKNKAVVNDMNNLSTDFFPSVEWLKATTKSAESVKEYARKMNINPDRENIDDVFLVVMDATCLVNWYNPEYESMHEEYLKDSSVLLNDLHDKYVNRITTDGNEIIKDLIDFYTACLTGENDTLLHEGTNFDRLIRERKEYIDDTEYDKVEVSRSEILERLGAFLPSDTDESTPEIDELDDEIFSKVGITPQRDANGKLLKGHQCLKKPKNIYSKKFPKFACDTCYAAAKCAEYKAGYVCAYQKLFTGFETRNLDDIIQAMHGMVNHNLSRMQRAMVMETINGTIDGEVSDLIDQNMRLLGNIQKLYQASPTVLKQTRVAQADGTTIETMSVSNPQSGGILEKLFSKKSDKPTVTKEDKEDIAENSNNVQSVAKVIEADFKEIKNDEATFEV